MLIFNSINIILNIITLKNIKCSDEQLIATFSIENNKDMVNVTYNGKEEIDHFYICTKDANSQTIEILSGPYNFEKPKTSTKTSKTMKFEVLKKLDENIEIFIKGNKTGGSPDNDKYSMSSMKKNKKYSIMTSLSNTNASGTINNTSEENNNKKGFFSKHKGICIGFMILVILMGGLIVIVVLRR